MLAHVLIKGPEDETLAQQREAEQGHLNIRAFREEQGVQVLRLAATVHEEPQLAERFRCERAWVSSGWEAIPLVERAPAEHV